MRPLALLADPIFRAVEREFYAYSRNIHHLETLEDRRSDLAVLRSPSEFRERVDSGGAYSNPIWQYIEAQEDLEEEIARYRLRVRPIMHMLDHLGESRAELVRLFDLKYRRQLAWATVEEEMSVSERTRKRLRHALVVCGARFLGYLG